MTVGAVLGKAEVLEARAGWWKHSAAPVLKEIPPGTPVEQARSVMQGHGVTCELDTHADGGPVLIGSAYRRTGWLCGYRTEVTLSCPAGKVR